MNPIGMPDVNDIAGEIDIDISRTIEVTFLCKCGNYNNFRWMSEEMPKFVHCTCGYHWKVRDAE